MSAALAGAATWWRSLRPAERLNTREALRARIAAGVGVGGTMRAAASAQPDGRRDHAVLRHVLLNVPSGANAAAERFDRWLLATHALAALRARRRFFHRELRLQLKSAPADRAMRILAFGAGPLPEALDVLDERGPDVPRAEVVLVDAAPDVVRAPGAPAVTFHAADPMSLLGAPPVDLLGDLDFAYSPYLFDHASDAEVLRSIDFLFAHLRPGGQLVFAHYDGELTDRDRLVLEAWLDWTPRFRTRKQLARLLDRTDAKRHGDAVGLVRGPNVYVVVQKHRVVAG